MITAELFPNMIGERGIFTVFAVNYLEVFDRRLRDPSREVQDIGSSVIIPNRRFIMELNKIIQLSVLETHQ